MEHCITPHLSWMLCLRAMLQWEAPALLGPTNTAATRQPLHLQYTSSYGDLLV